MAKIENKYNTLFFFDKVGPELEGRLRVRIRWNKTLMGFSLGIRVEIAKWSIETQRCKNGTSHGKNKIPYNIINSQIQTVENAINDIFNQFDFLECIPTKEQFQQAYNKKFGKDNPAQLTTINEKKIFDYYDEFVKEQGTQNDWTAATFQKFAAMKNHLLLFDTPKATFAQLKKAKNTNDLSDFKKQISFDTFNEKGLNDYVIFLRDIRELRNTTILKQISFLKWFLNWTTTKGYNQNSYYSKFSPNIKTTDKKVIFLDWKELMTVYNFDFSTANLDPKNAKALEKVRDVFCFCCFTSLRYSDVENLKRSDIKADTLEITTLKTADTLTIDLNNYSRAILLKYSKEVYTANKALPVISNQRMNDHLKTVCELCGLDTPTTITYFKGSKRIDEVYPKYALIGTHAGRRTFICNALSLGIAPQTVMKWTGHADYKSMKPYIDIADAEKAKAMNLFNNR